MASQPYGASGDSYIPAETERDRRLRLRQEERAIRKMTADEDQNHEQVVVSSGLASRLSGAVGKSKRDEVYEEKRRKFLEAQEKQQNSRRPPPQQSRFAAELEHEISSPPSFQRQQTYSPAAINRQPPARYEQEDARPSSPAAARIPAPSYVQERITPPAIERDAGSRFQQNQFQEDRQPPRIAQNSRGREREDSLESTPRRDDRRAVQQERDEPTPTKHVFDSLGEEHRLNQERIKQEMQEDYRRAREERKMKKKGIMDPDPFSRGTSASEFDHQPPRQSQRAEDPSPSSQRQQNDYGAELRKQMEQKRRQKEEEKHQHMYGSGRQSEGQDEDDRGGSSHNQVGVSRGSGLRGIMGTDQSLEEQQMKRQKQQEYLEELKREKEAAKQRREREKREEQENEMRNVEIEEKRMERERNTNWEREGHSAHPNQAQREVTAHSPPTQRRQDTPPSFDRRESVGSGRVESSPGINRDEPNFARKALVTNQQDEEERNKNVESKMSYQAELRAQREAMRRRKEEEKNKARIEAELEAERLAREEEELNKKYARELEEERRKKEEKDGKGDVQTPSRQSGAGKKGVALNPQDKVKEIEAMQEEAARAFLKRKEEDEQRKKEARLARMNRANEEQPADDVQPAPARRFSSAFDETPVGGGAKTGGQTEDVRVEEKKEENDPVAAALNARLKKREEKKNAFRSAVQEAEEATQQPPEEEDWVARRERQRRERESQFAQQEQKPAEESPPSPPKKSRKGHTRSSKRSTRRSDSRTHSRSHKRHSHRRRSRSESLSSESEWSSYSGSSSGSDRSTSSSEWSREERRRRRKESERKRRKGDRREKKRSDESDQIEKLRIRLLSEILSIRNESERAQMMALLGFPSTSSPSSGISRTTELGIDEMQMFLLSQQEKQLKQMEMALGLGKTEMEAKDSRPRVHRSRNEKKEPTPQPLPGFGVSASDFDDAGQTLRAHSSFPSQFNPSSTFDPSLAQHESSLDGHIAFDPLEQSLRADSVFVESNFVPVKNGIGLGASIAVPKGQKVEYGLNPTSASHLYPSSFPAPSMPGIGMGMRKDPHPSSPTQPSLFTVTPPLPPLSSTLIAQSDTNTVLGQSFMSPFPTATTLPSDPAPSTLPPNTHPHPSSHLPLSPRDDSAAPFTAIPSGEKKAGGSLRQVGPVRPVSKGGKRPVSRGSILAQQKKEKEGGSLGYEPSLSATAPGRPASPTRPKSKSSRPSSGSRVGGSVDHEAEEEKVKTEIERLKNLTSTANL
ncbi:hypothetical protein BLNAU_13757 [Blattamonas nauphoetae]|uniref:Uncharacterized protein n=1 Tax=Blattamonas nauphoetae TaxID=2049346 RepID=A0ABQ9XJ93_9EUKA|nr:hypothetical protein BLNAU_13757 [Blattamonas nauphoetae]